MKKIATTFWLILLCLSLFAQSNTKFGRTYTSELSPAFQQDIPKLRTHILNGIPDAQKTGRYERMTYRYSDRMANVLAELISSGRVYSDWPELEAYVNQVLDKVIPEELKEDSVIHAYIYRDADMNAFMTASGQAFVNIGLLTYVQNESELASILAHELAHYYKRHVLKRFLQEETGQLSWGMVRSQKKTTRFSVGNELEADSLAMVWLKNSGYAITGTLETFKMMQRIEKQALRRYKNVWEFKKTTHPLNKDRLLEYQTFIQANVADGKGEYFLIDETKFHAFQKEARAESLQMLLNDFSYYSCIQRAFNFHLFDPNNKVYVYYLMESIRRYCYMNPERWNDHFIMDRYYNVTGNVKVEAENHLFEQFDQEVMAIAPLRVGKIEARFYWSEMPKFTTYEEAFVFFFQVSKLLDCSECLLSNALSYTSDKKKRNELLQQYLKKENILYKDYAERLLTGDIIKSLSDQKLLVFNEFEAYVRQGKQDIPLALQSENYGADLSAIFDSVTVNFPNRVPLYMPSLKKNKLNDYIMLKELEKFSSFATISKGERTELHILDPRFVEMFTRYNVNEIEFINCTYREFRKSEKSVEEYQEVSEMDYQTMFLQTKRTRALQTWIYGLTMSETAPMKIRYYSGESSLKFNQTGFDEIVGEIHQQILLKNRRAKELMRTKRILEDE